MRTFWTAKETEYVVKHYGKIPTAQIATRLGRTEKAIYQRAFGCGVGKKRCPTGPEFWKFVAARYADGWSDAVIAAAWSQKYPQNWGVERHKIEKWRHKHGLPSNRNSDHTRGRVAQKTRIQCEQAGVKNLGELRSKVHRERSAKAGWPRGMRPRAVQILNALWDHGPMTRAEICRAIGLPWHGSRSSMSYLANLTARGLVVSLGRVVRGRGRGKSTQVYSLPLFVERGPVEVKDAKSN